MQQTTSTEKSKSNGNGKWAQGTQSAQTQAADLAKDAATGIQDTARKIYDQAMEVGSDFVSQANKRVPELVREYPVYATLGGIFLGFLLGASLTGRRSMTRAE